MNENSHFIDPFEDFNKNDTYRTQPVKFKRKIKILVKSRRVVIYLPDKYWEIVDKLVRDKEYRYTKDIIDSALLRSQKRYPVKKSVKGDPKSAKREDCGPVTRRIVRVTEAISARALRIVYLNKRKGVSLQGLIEEGLDILLDR